MKILLNDIEIIEVSGGSVCCKIKRNDGGTNWMSLPDGRGQLYYNTVCCKGSYYLATAKWFQASSSFLCGNDAKWIGTRFHCEESSASHSQSTDYGYYDSSNYDGNGD